MFRRTRSARAADGARLKLGKDEHGNVVRKAGIMAIVLASGEVRPGDPIRVILPLEPHQSLKPV